MNTTKEQELIESNADLRRRLERARELLVVGLVKHPNIEWRDRVTSYLDMEREAQKAFAARRFQRV